MADESTPGTRIFSTFQVFLRDLRVMFRMVRKPLLFMLVALGGGAFITRTAYPEWSWDHAIHAVVELAVLNPTERYADAPTGWARFLYFVMPLAGITGGLGVIQQVLLALFARRRRTQDWEIGTASIMDKHVVVCGLGTVGTDVVLGLAREGCSMALVAIESDEHQPGIDIVRDLGIPVVLGDARRTRTLERAGIGKASVLVLAGDDDNLHVAILLKARDLRPKDTSPLKTVIRCFDPRLPKLIEDGKDVEIVDANRAIAQAMLERLGPDTPLTGASKVAVVGLGKVGLAVATRLIQEKLPAGNITLVDRDLPNTWARSAARAHDWSACPMFPKDLADFIEDVANKDFDVVFVTTGDDMTYFLCGGSKELLNRRTIVRTKHLPPQGLGRVIAVNTTEITSPLLIHKTLVSLGLCKPEPEA